MKYQPARKRDIRGLSPCKHNVVVVVVVVDDDVNISSLREHVTKQKKNNKLDIRGSVHYDIIYENDQQDATV